MSVNDAHQHPSSPFSNMNTMNNIGHWKSLPIELTIAIIDEIDDRALLVLATVSRHFHRVAMDAYFSRGNFNPHSSNIALMPSSRVCEDSRQILAGMAIYLGNVGASIDQLTYQPGYVSWDDNEPTTLAEILLLTRYIEKLSSVSKVTFCISALYRDDYEEYQRSIIILLKTVLEKSCKSIQIDEWVYQKYEEPAFVPPLFLPAKPSDWLGDYWPKGYEPSLATPRHLEEVAIEWVDSFLMPFYYHLLRWNVLSITTICFKRIFEEDASDWGTMMAELYFPSLTRLSVVNSTIPRQPFLHFLARQPSIQEFHHRNIRYISPGLRSRVKKHNLILQRLETVATPPEDFLYFFPPIDRMSALKTLVIQVEKWDKHFISLEKVLRYLSSCKNKIAFSIRMMNGQEFGAWFDLIMLNGLDGRPESLLHCVDTLSLDAGNMYWDDDVLRLLPAWLHLFPALRAFTLRGNVFYSSSPFVQPPVDTLLDTLKAACPGIHIEWHKQTLINQNFI